MPNLTKEELIAITDAAFAQRLEGNDALKAGKLQEALRSYHAVLLRLKGLESQLQSAFGTDPSSSGIARGTTAEQEAATKPKEPSLQEKVKTAIGLVYLNSAAIHVKTAKYARALECAQQALRIDENNNKAKFREAQARIGLGELSRGKQALEELQKKAPDSAITNALRQLAIDEKARSAKANSSFKGMYSKKPATTAADDGCSTKLPPGLEIPPGLAGAGSTDSATITETDADAETGAAEVEADMEAGASSNKQPAAPVSEVPADSLAQA